MSFISQKRIARAAALVITTFGIAAPLCAQSAQEPPLQLQRLTGPITIDGIPDEPAWQDITPLPLTMYTPVFRGAPTQRSEIRVAYDDQYLYAAGWFYDTDPSGIRVNSLYRDRWNGDDAFAIYIDAFNDNQNAKWFGTTPAGMRFDVLVSNDGQTQNDSWDTFWDAKSRITTEGWFSEIRIPFSSLGFQARAGKAVMGLTVTRFVSRLNERVTFPEIDPKFQFRQASVARDVVLTNVHSSKPLYVTPYALTGMDQRPILALGAPEFHTERRMSREAGVDLRYALTSELTVDVTTNTDFAQVEADDEQINLDRFDLFFPEKRRFFQEHSDIFDFALGGSSRLFHSRQVGLVNGVSVPVLGGARVVGRVGRWDVGLLNMQTNSDLGAPSENFGVFRLKHPVFNANSYVGGMVTSRLSNGRYNVAYATDASVRVIGHDYIAGQVAQTTDDADTTHADITDRSQVHLSWFRRSNRGLNYATNLTHIGSAFRPELGFLPRADFTSITSYVQYYKYTDTNPTLARYYPGIYAEAYYRNRDHVMETGKIATWVEFETKKGGDGWFEPQLFHEDVLEAFTIASGADVPRGTYTFANLWLHWAPPSGKKLRTEMDLQTGTYFDGTRTQLILSPTWNVSPHLELGGDYIGNRLRFGSRAPGADIHLARARVRIALNARASGNAFVQYNSTTDRLNMNLRLRYNFAEGTDLWLVYDEGLATDRLSSDPIGPRLPLSASRSLILKYSRTFQM